MKNKSTGWKNESEDGTVVQEVKPSRLVCQNCEGGLVVNTSKLGGFDRCSVCLGTGYIN